MADQDVKIKISLDGDKEAAAGLRGVGDAASESDGKLGSLVSGGLKGAGAALVGTAAAAVAAGTALVTSVVNSYADYEQALGGIETMFGNHASTVIANSEQAYITAGLSGTAYMEQVTSFSASLLQGLGGDTAEAARIADMAMVDMSDNANKFGTDIEAIQSAYQGFAKDNYTMLDNLKLGYGGTASEMARLINDSGVLGDTMEVTAANVNDVSFDKIIEAIHTVQTEMGVAGTTSLEASQTISGSIGMLQGAWANLLVGLGSADADVATLAGNVISSFENVVANIVPVITNIGENLGTLGPQLGSMAQGLVEAIVAAIPAVLEAGVAIIEGLIQGIVSAAPGLITALIPGLLMLVDSVLTMLPMLLTAAVQIVLALAQGITQALPTLIPVAIEVILQLVTMLIQNLPLLLDAGMQIITAIGEGLIASMPIIVAMLPPLIDAIVQFLTGPASTTMMSVGLELFMALIEQIGPITDAIVAAVPLIITNLVSALQSNIPAMVQSGFTLLTALVQNIGGITSTIVGKIPGVISALGGAIRGGVSQMASAGLTMLLGIGQNIGSVTSDVLGKITGLISSAASAVRGGVGQMISAGHALLMGLATGIGNAVGAVIAKAREVAGRIVDSVKSFFGIKSPSRLMRDTVGLPIAQGIGEGITRGAPYAARPLERLAQQLQADALSILPSFYTTAYYMQSTPQHVSQVLSRSSATPVVDYDRLGVAVAKAIAPPMRTFARAVVQSISMGADLAVSDSVLSRTGGWTT